MKDLQALVSIFAALAVMMAFITLLRDPSTTEPYREPPRKMTEKDLPKYGIYQNNAAFDNLGSKLLLATDARFLQSDLGNAKASSLTAKDVTVDGKFMGRNIEMDKLTINDVAAKNAVVQTVSATYAASGELVAKEKMCVGDYCVTPEVMKAMVENTSSHGTMKTDNLDVMFNKGNGESAMSLRNPSQSDHLRVSHDGHTLAFDAGGVDRGIAFRTDATKKGYPAPSYHENMRIMPDGRITINGALSVDNGINDWNWLRMYRNEKDHLYFGGDNTNRGIWSHGERPFSIYTSGANRQSIDATGKTSFYGTNKTDWNHRVIGPNGTNIHAVHGAGYGLHVNTVNQDADKYGLEIHNGKQSTFKVRNDGLVFHNNPTDDWGFRSIRPNGGNVHMNHGAGYGIHVNTVDDHPEKYGLEVHNNKHHTLHVKNDGRHFMQHSNKGDWGMRMIGPNSTNIHAVHGAGYGLHINTVNQEPEKYGLEVHNGKQQTLLVRNDGRIIHTNPSTDWGFLTHRPNGGNVHMNHGAGYGIHINTVDDHPEKYGLEVHNNKHHTLHVKNDGRHFLHHSNPNDWGFRMTSGNGQNIHAVHSAGYGVHVNTNNQENGKYALELHNNKKPLLHVRNDDEIIQFRKDGRATHFDHTDGKNYLRGETIVDDRLKVNGPLCVEGVCISGKDLQNFVKHGEEITLRNVKTGHRLQGTEGTGSAQFGNKNRGWWERMHIEKCASKDGDKEAEGVGDKQKCWAD